VIHANTAFVKQIVSALLLFKLRRFINFFIQLVHLFTGNFRIHWWRTSRGDLHLIRFYGFNVVVTGNRSARFSKCSRTGSAEGVVEIRRRHERYTEKCDDSKMVSATWHSLCVRIQDLIFKLHNYNINFKNVCYLTLCSASQC